MGIWIVVASIDELEAGEYGVNETFSVAYISTDKAKAEKVLEELQANNTDSSIEYSLTEAETDKNYENNGPTLAGSFYLE